ncbi:MAG: HPr family phosphocarrier protein [Sedimentisphaerales bacterium]|nr:HPr family phosphocarrier protein [Sedimentisphaerales bacterium]
MAERMHELKVQIKNADGLHMRPAMQFVDLASTFESDIHVSNGETTVDAKSIMQMTMLAATCGSTLTIRAEGQDAKQAVEALQTLVERDLFGKAAKATGDIREDG